MGKDKNQPTQEEIEISRIRVPRSPEVLGVVEAMVGGDRLRAKCDDGNDRICRIPGKMRKRIWIRTGDLILLKPWVVQGNEKADVIFKYTSTQANWLRRKGYVKGMVIE
jgi:translation initiation factor 1A